MNFKRNIGILLAVFLFVFLTTPTTFAISDSDAAILQEKYGIDREGSKNLSQNEVDTILKSTFVPTVASPKDSFKGSLDVVDCFDYYTFGSVSADMTSRSSIFTAGSDIEFSGNIVNNNPYPLVNGSLYVKILKIKKDSEKNVNGPDVVDQFFALKDISIPAHGQFPAKFSWKVPVFAEAGDYRIVTYFETAEAFNLLGLSFTDDIVGNTFNFSIKSENKNGGVVLNKSNVKINGNPYYFAAFPPRIENKKAVTISAEVKNTTKQVQHVNVTWTLYTWDALKKENIVQNEVMTVTVKANATSSASITLPYGNSPVYLAEAKLVYKDTSSILNIRYIQDGVDKLRINFPSITSYPLVEGQKTTAFACLHNSGTSSMVDKGKLILRLLDKNNKEFYRYEYNGVVTGEMMAVKEDFVPKKTYDTFTMKAELFQDGKLVDSAQHVYECSKLGPNTCLIAPTSNSKILQKVLVYVLFSIGVIALILSILFKMSKNKKDYYKSIFGSFLIIFSVAGYIFSAQSVHAKSTSWSSGIIPNLEYFWTNTITGLSGWATGLGSSNVNINYDTVVKMADGTILNDGDNIPTGSVLSLIFKKHVPTDVNWSGTGYSQGTPYGNWSSSAPSSVSCTTDDYVSSTGYYDVYVPLLVTPPSKSLTGLSGMTCGFLSLDTATGDHKMPCTVQPGVTSLNPVFNLAATTGRYYYRYFEKPGSPSGQTGCFGNSTPMRAASTLSTYSLSVPARSISYSFNARDTTGNTAPVVSVLGSTDGFTTVNYTFSVSGGDSNGDSMSLGIDWNEDGDINTFDGNIEWFASAVPNGGSANVSKIWSTAGTKTFRVIAKDSKGVKSAWATHSISLTVPEPDFDFILDRANRDVIISAGQSGSNSITATKIAGASKPVSLSVTSIKNSAGVEVKNQPNGISVGPSAFSINPLSPTGTSNLTLSTSQSTPLDTVYTVTVAASSGTTPGADGIIFHDIPNMSTDTTHTISYYVCEVYSATGCVDYYPLTTQTLGDALNFKGYAGGFRFYNDQYTRDKVCSTLYPDAPKHIGNITPGIFSSPSDNGVIYWSEVKGAFVVLEAPFEYLDGKRITPNNPVNPYISFTCSNIVIDKTNTITDVINSFKGSSSNFPVVPVYNYESVGSRVNGAPYPNLNNTNLYNFNEFPSLQRYRFFYANFLTVNALCKDLFPDTPFAVSYESYYLRQPWALPVNIYSNTLTYDFHFRNTGGWWSMDNTYYFSGSPLLDFMLNGNLVCASGLTNPGTSDVTRTTSFYVTVSDPFQLTAVPSITPVYPNCDPNINLSWNLIPNASSYQISRTYLANNNTDFYGISGTTLTDSDNLISGGNYSYSVRAVVSSSLSEPSSGVTVTAPTLPPGCFSSSSDFNIYTQGLTMSVPSAGIAKGVIPVTIIKNGAVDKKINDIYLLVAPQSSTIYGAWRPATIAGNTAQIVNGHNTCTSIESAGKCKFEYEVSVTKDAVAYNNQSLIVRAFAQENNNGAIGSKDVTTSIKVTKSTVGNLKMWLVDKDKNNESKSNIKIKKGEDVDMKWGVLGRANFIACKALLTQDGNDTGFGLNDFVTDNTETSYQIASTSIKNASTGGLVKGTYYFTMNCMDEDTGEDVIATVYNNEESVSLANRLTITVTTSELKER